MRPVSRRDLFGFSLAGLIFCEILLRNAWLCDDAFITFRTVDNFIHGYGLRWNIAERVQAYTHPLWLLLISGGYAITREIWVTSLFLAMVVSLLAVTILGLKIARSLRIGAIILLLLSLSRAFIDYSSAGLENPLSHLLLALFIVRFSKPASSSRDIFWLALPASLGLLNRLDTLWLFLPPLLVVAWKKRSRTTLLALFCGFLPLIFWECFSLIYYGFPFPNTAYAKLFSEGLPIGVKIVHGGYYLLNSLRHDPLTLVLIGLGLALPLREKQGRQLPLVIGVGLYLGYVIGIGGDFMSGRFLTLPLFGSLALLAESRLWQSVHLARRVSAILLLLGLCGSLPTFLSGTVYDIHHDPNEADSRIKFDEGHGIVDERGYYFEATSLGRAGPWQPGKILPHEWAESGLYFKAMQRSPITLGPIGIFGYYAGPTIHIVDLIGLADPLLARIPGRRNRNWFIGHSLKAVPDGYLDSIRTGQNFLTPPALAQYYEHLRLITQGPIWSRDRFLTIWRMNWGSYDHLLTNLPPAIPIVP